MCPALFKVNYVTAVVGGWRGGPTEDGNELNIGRAEQLELSLRDWNDVSCLFPHGSAFFQSLMT